MDRPYEDTIVRVKYFYRADGTLESKECYYNEREFGTTEHSQKYYYDEKDRLDFFGALASTDYFIQYERNGLRN